MPDLPVNILLQVKDRMSAALGTAKDGLKQLDSGLTKTGESTSLLGNAMSTAAGVMIRDLAQGITRTIGESISLGANLSALRSSFNTLTQTTGGTTLSLDALRSATRNTVADVDLLKQANAAMALGLPTDQIDELFAASLKLGRAMGIDTKFAVESLTTGIGRQSKMILDNLGVTFKAEDAYAAYAKQLGVTTNELDENQKRLAWQSYAIEQVTARAEALGDIQDDAVTGLEAWDASIKNFTTSIGAVFAPLGAFAGILQSLLPIISTMAMSIIPSLTAQFGILGTAEMAVAYATQYLSVAINSLMGPLGIVLLAVGAFALAWSQNWFGIRDTTNSIIDSINRGFESMAEANMRHATDALAEIVQSYNSQIEAIQSGMREQLAAVEQGLVDQLEAVEKANQDKINETIKFFMDELEETSTGFDSVRMAYADHYDDLINEVEKGLDVQLNSIQRNLSQQTSDLEAFHNSQIREVETYYDTLLAVTSDRLNGIRDARSDSLDHLELSFLQEKAALRQSLEDGKMTEEEYTAALTALERTYRETRATVSDEFRIQELEAEFLNKENIIVIAEEKAAALAALEQETAITKAALQAEAIAVELAAQEEANSQILELRQALQEQLTLINEAELELENQHQTAITEANTAAAEQRSTIQKEAAASMTKLTEDTLKAINRLTFEYGLANNEIWKGIVANMTAAVSAGRQLAEADLNYMIETARRIAGTTMTITGVPGGTTAAAPMQPQGYGVISEAEAIRRGIILPVSPTVTEVNIYQDNNMLNMIDSREAGAAAYQEFLRRLAEGRP